MHQKRVNPTAGGHGVRKIEPEKSRFNLPITSDSNLPAKEFWLHVCDDDGTERHYRHQPDVRAIYVTVNGGIEQTHTRNRDVWDEFGFVVSAIVRPRGSGWTIADYDNEITAWQRKAVRP